MLTMSKRKTFNVNFKLQLDSIFDSMRRTKCNFVFCSLITTVPNSADSNTLLDVNLLRRQLKAYQVLAACRIYRQGYPDHLNLEDFERKFSMFLPSGMSENVQSDTADSHKKACMNILSSLELDSTLFKFGITQVFFKAGVLARLDDQRDKKLNDLIVRLQSTCRMYLAQNAMEKRRVQDSAIRCIQKNVRISFVVKKWKWWRLYTNLMPIINVQNTEAIYKQCKEELEEFRRKNERLNTEKNNLLVMNNQLENKVGI
jgi:myosin heavy subunit